MVVPKKIPKKISTSIKYLTDLGYKVSGSYVSPNKKQIDEDETTDEAQTEDETTDEEQTEDETTDEEQTEDETTDEERDERNEEREEREETPRKTSLTPKEKVHRFVKDNKHNWNLLSKDCEGNFSKSYLNNFSKRMGIKIKKSESPKKICNVLKKELKKHIK